MADHQAGPRGMANPEIDITDLYAFPSPERPGYLVLVLDVFPKATISTLFSDAVDHRFRLRPLRVASTGRRAAFEVGEPERVISFTFGAPQSLGGSADLAQPGTCRALGSNIAFSVGDEAGAESKGVRVFAGCRLDTFFVDQGFSGGLRQNRRIPERSACQNFLDGQNVLSIVVEVDSAGLFGAGAGPLVAVIAETTTLGSFRARQDRVGRPEIKNFIMMDKASDAVNKDLDVRDLYSEEDGFKLRPDYLGAYRARLNGSMATYDKLDGKTDWPLDEEGNHPLTELFLADFLVADVSKPFAEVTYLEIERAMLRGESHETCGGRWMNDDIVDTLFTVLINNGNGPRISDGVDRPTELASRTFPYMPRPNPNPPPWPTLVGIPA